MVIIFINQLFMICVVFECLSLSVKALKDDIVGEAVVGASCAKMQMAVEVSVLFDLCCKIIYLRSYDDRWFNNMFSYQACLFFKCL